MHVPERRCVGCGARAPRAHLARFVAQPSSGGRELVRDVEGRRPGRGVYICPTRGCFDKAVERRGFHRGAKVGDEPLRIDSGLADEFGR
jgi:predicted RNA-binding protein YlxR (DUF448 family)